MRVETGHQTTTKHSNTGTFEFLREIQGPRMTRGLVSHLTQT